MQKIIYICDKCGKSSESSDFLKTAYEYEICDKCFKKFDDHIKAFFEGFDAQAPLPAPKKEKKAPKAEKPADETAEKKHKPIDWDKACALKIAGWSNKYIAEELGANRPTIDSMIYKKVEQYKDGVRFGKQEEADDGSGEDY